MANDKEKLAVVVFMDANGFPKRVGIILSQMLEDYDAWGNARRADNPKNKKDLIAYSKATASQENEWNKKLTAAAESNIVKWVVLDD